MHPQKWMEAALGAPSRIRILRVLAADPQRAWTERELAHAVAMSPNGVNKAVRQLEGAGLLAVHRLGGTHAVRLSAGSASRLRRLFRLEAEAWDEVLDAIRRALPPDAACYVFGSTAAGAPGPESDVDLLIVARDREAAREAAHAVEVKARERFPTPLRIIALGRDEARRRARSGVVRAALATGRPVGPRRLEGLV